MKVKNFAGFMRSRLNESEEMEKYEAGLYGANPEEEDMAAELEGMEDEEGFEDEEGAEEEVTLEDLKAMVEELTERVEALEGGGEEDEDAEGEEGEEDEDVEGEEDAEGEEEEV